ncbi:YdcF family protein [Leptodesmis sp.]|uniref:YdcF family protein n=1 Tax=Leptodesmis sp. TaxID=3100501 RepID=UPI003D0A0F5E
MFTMKALILLALLGILWLISSRRWRHRVLAPIAILILSSLAITSPVGITLTTWGLTFSLPSDSGEPVDTIVVVGRGEELRHRRVEVVEEQWQTKRAKKIFASGMLDAPEMIERLKDNGIPGRVISGERCSQSTEENAIFTAALLNPQKHPKILLITDQPHLLRSFLTFRSFGFTVIPHPSLFPSQWNSRQRILLIAREYAALAHYALTNRFQPRPLEQVKQPQPEVLHKIADWKCHIQAT